MIDIIPDALVGGVAGYMSAIYRKSASYPNTILKHSMSFVVAGIVENKVRNSLKTTNLENWKCDLISGGFWEIALALPTSGKYKVLAQSMQHFGSYSIGGAIGIMSAKIDQRRR